VGFSNGTMFSKHLVQ